MNQNNSNMHLKSESSDLSNNIDKTVKIITLSNGQIIIGKIIYILKEYTFVSLPLLIKYSYDKDNNANAYFQHYLFPFSSLDPLTPVIVNNSQVVTIIQPDHETITKYKEIYDKINMKNIENETDAMSSSDLDETKDHRNFFYYSSELVH